MTNTRLLLFAVALVPFEVAVALCSSNLHELPLFVQDPDCQGNQSCDEEFCFGVAIWSKSAPLHECCGAYDSCRDTTSFFQTLDTLQSVSGGGLAVSSLIFLLTMIKMACKNNDAGNRAAVIKRSLNAVLVALSIVTACLGVWVVVVLRVGCAKDFLDEFVRARCFDPTNVSPTVAKVDDYSNIAVSLVAVGALSAVVHTLEVNGIGVENAWWGELIFIGGTGLDVAGFCLAIANLVIIGDVIASLVTLYESMRAPLDAVSTGACLLSTCLRCLVSNCAVPTNAPSHRTIPPTLQSPVASPIFEPPQEPITNAPSVPQAPSPINDSLEEQWKLLIQTQSPSTTFENTNSAQSKALDWMLADSYSRSLSDDDLVLQRFAVVTFYYSTGGPTSWSGSVRWLLPGVNECEWDRLSCAGMVVRQLTMASGLRGTIPVEVGLLTRLTDVSLSSNPALVGSIPSEVGRWVELTRLLLSNDQLSGSLPSEIGEWTSLTHFAVNGNELLEGSLPSEIGRWTDLEVLSFSGDSISGSLPYEIGGWTELSNLNAEGNKLTGALPTTVGRWTSLRAIDLAMNSMTGSIPSQIAAMTRLTFADFRDNDFSGAIPSEIAELTSLGQLYLSGNFLTGTLPSSLCSNLRDAWIDCLAISCACCTDDDRTRC